jgi:hypothetical protein
MKSTLAAERESADRHPQLRCALEGSWAFSFHFPQHAITTVDATA